MSTGSVSRHHAALLDKHSEIEKSIHIEENRPHPNDDELKRLKVHKLHLKEIMEGVRSEAKAH